MFTAILAKVHSTQEAMVLCNFRHFICTFNAGHAAWQHVSSSTSLLVIPGEKELLVTLLF